MKKGLCLVLALMLAVLFGGNALAEKVDLPQSGYSVTIPDGMAYSGKRNSADDVDFVWLSDALGLEIQFTHAKNDRNVTLKAMATVLREDGYDAEIRRVSGIDMIVYEGTDPDDDPAEAMKFITYVFLEGDVAQQICFWYANQNAADLTLEIIERIPGKD